MKNIIADYVKKTEDYTITRYGFECSRTINTFKFTAIIRFIFAIY
jgi:hypothetical protein